MIEQLIIFSLGLFLGLSKSFFTKKEEKIPHLKLKIHTQELCNEEGRKGGLVLDFRFGPDPGDDNS